MALRPEQRTEKVNVPIVEEFCLRRKEKKRKEKEKLP